MDWYGLFLRLDGRIGRKAFWIGFGAVALVILVADLITRGVGAAAILPLLLLYPLIAVVVKRLHDRGRSGWWAAALGVPVGAALVSALVARVAGLGEAGIERAATGAIWITVAVLAALVIVELGLRRGDPGYSEHGPPPLA